MGRESEDFEPYLNPTPIIDSDHEIIQDFARSKVGESLDPIDQAVKLFLAVRDGIRYDPYSPFIFPSITGQPGTQKGPGLLCSQGLAPLCLGRACRIPSRLGFATVRNHLATRQLIEFIGSNLLSITDSLNSISKDDG